MARYKVLELSLIGNAMVEANTEIGDGTPYPFDGYPGSNLEPLDDEGRAKAVELVELNKQRIRDMQAANPLSPTLDPEALGLAIGKAVADAMTAMRAEQQDLNDRLALALERLAASQVDPAPAADAAATATTKAPKAKAGDAAPAADAAATA